MENILQIKELTKIIDGRKIVSNFNMKIKKGEIYGFLGPNGAGKSSIMKMILNLWKPSMGAVEIFGKEINEKSYDIFKRMGSIIENPVFYEDLSGYENIKLHCEYMGYYNEGSIEESMKLLSVSPYDKKTVKKYSLGMKQRLAIARAITTKPELLILDEPINGLDPEGVKQIRDLLKILSIEYGITILISSHILSEIESLANTIGIINNGTMLEEVSIEEIENMIRKYIEIKVKDSKKTLYIITETLKIDNVKLLDDNIIRIYDEDYSVTDITKVLTENGVDIEGISQRRENLEEHYLKIIKGEKYA